MIFLGSGFVTLILGLTPGITASELTVEPDGDWTAMSSFASTSDSDEASLGAAATHEFETRGDNVHMSTDTDGYPAVSGHGCWAPGPGESAYFSTKTANVVVEIQWKTGDDWQTVERSQPKALKYTTQSRGCPSSRRTVARERCASRTSYHEWRSVVDVDIIGVIHGPEKGYTTPQTLRCKP